MKFFTPERDRTGPPPEPAGNTGITHPPAPIVEPGQRRLHPADQAASDGTPPDPIPVRIVGVVELPPAPKVRKSREVAPDAWVPIRTQVTEQARGIIGANPRRRSLILINSDDEESIALGVSDGVTFAAGTLLGPGATVVMTHTAAVHAISDGAASVLLTGWAEFDTGMDEGR